MKNNKEIHVKTKFLFTRKLVLLYIAWISNNYSTNFMDNISRSSFTLVQFANNIYSLWTGPIWSNKWSGANNIEQNHI